MIKLSFLINFTMNYLKVTLIISLFFYGSAVEFQYWKMAQTWPSGFCAHKACDATKTIPFKFTIHGLWPSNYSIPQPSLCSSTGLNISLVSFYFMIILFRYYI